MRTRCLVYLVVAATVGWWLTLSPLAAQSLTRTLENLVGTPPSETAAQPASATDQLPWAQEQAEESRRQRELFSSDAFRERLAAANFPQDSRPDFLRQAQLALDHWGNAVIVLENIIARETAHRLAPEAITPPKNSEEALALDQELTTLQERLTQINFEQQALAENLQSAEQRLRVAQRGLSALPTPSPAPTEAPAEGTAPLLTEIEALEVQLAQITLLAAEGDVFYQRWNQYRQSL